jgi:hypothetical protein
MLSVFARQPRGTSVNTCQQQALNEISPANGRFLRDNKQKTARLDRVR